MLCVFHVLLFQSTVIGQSGSRHLIAATENARPDIARLYNSAPYRKGGGHRESCFIVRVEAQIKLTFAAASII